MLHKPFAVPFFGLKIVAITVWEVAWRQHQRNEVDLPIAENATNPRGPKQRAAVCRNKSTAVAIPAKLRTPANRTHLHPRWDRNSSVISAYIRFPPVITFTRRREYVLAMRSAAAAAASKRRDEEQQQRPPPHGKDPSASAGLNAASAPELDGYEPAKTRGMDVVAYPPQPSPTSPLSSTSRATSPPTINSGAT